MTQGRKKAPIIPKRLIFGDDDLQKNEIETFLKLYKVLSSVM